LYLIEAVPQKWATAGISIMIIEQSNDDELKTKPAEFKAKVTLWHHIIYVRQPDANCINAPELFLAEIRINQLAFFDKAQCLCYALIG
jgi:hypothetical protein